VTSSHRSFQDPRSLDPSQRVVITGVGAVTPLGLDVPSFWAALLRGDSGAAEIKSFDASTYDTKFACELKGFDALRYVERKLANRLDPVCHYALAATAEALRDAAVDPAAMSEDERNRVGVVLGTGIGGIQAFQKQSVTFVQHGHKRLSPFFIPTMIADMGPGIVSMQYGFRGPNHCAVSACATGNHNLADALMLIRSGQAEMIVTGGTEAAICELGVGGFNAAKALSTRNDEPTRASRPFDRGRDGFVMGEGAGSIIVESLEHARARGVRIYAEVLAVGASADAYHMTAPHPEGIGARLAMQRALEQSHVDPSEVDSLNMHGTSTQLGDIAETRAVREVFGAHADRLVATSTKSMTGHALGAAGAIEAIATVLSITNGIVPPTINGDDPDPACDINIAFNTAVHRPVRIAMSNAFGFGGHNTCAVFAAFDDAT
jgi:3-oxoacyl-[acyl-carrier-protein] synthase II